MFIFLGAPYVERLRHNRAWAAALTCITASVVGVVLNLSVWFAIHVLFRQVNKTRWGPVHLMLPRADSLDPAALALAVLATFSLFRWKLGMVRTLGLSLFLGVLWKLLPWKVG